MKQIAVTVNGTPVEALIEPRTHLADFLREQQRLTGTHLGCEQGVCGACTILLNGAPARACLTLAVSCDGADIRTVEGFADDSVMVRLREAFSAEHALQCGFCTPGMLISSYHIDRPPDEVWTLFGDAASVAGCLPGAVLDDTEGGNLKGRMQVRLGPISAAFAGTATHERDAAARIGTLAGGGADQRGNSRVRGRVTYRLIAENGGQASAGPLTPQFLRARTPCQFAP